MALRIAINGLGRIGRMVLRRVIPMPEIQIVAINACYPPTVLAHLLQYDAVHGYFNHQIQPGEGQLSIDGQEIQCVAERDPARLPWRDYAIDIVVEATGSFTARAGAQKHCQAGAERVVVTAPGQGLDATVVMGVNETTYDPHNHRLVSCASCTTNALAPIVSVVEEVFGVERGLLTTIHAYTSDQKLLDDPHKDLRRARASALSMIPTKTGAAQTIGEVIPSLAGRLHGLAVRVPVPNVSLLDLVVDLKRTADAAAINEALQTAAQGKLAGYLDYSDIPLVSTDYNGNPHSATVDGVSTMVVEGKQAKILAWYDNEWGYVCRVVDLLRYMAAQAHKVT